MSFIRNILLTFALIAAAFVSFDVSAQVPEPGEPELGNTCEEIVRKLGRGVSNVAFGALEVPIKIWDCSLENGGIAGVTYGTFNGIVYCVCREVVGVVEIVTFFMPLPNCPMNRNETGWGYGPIMYPEWIVDLNHNAFNIVYPNTPIIQ